MGGVLPETCWAWCKYEIKFWYIVASCWIFYVNYTMMHGSTNIKFNMDILKKELFKENKEMWRNRYLIIKGRNIRMRGQLNLTSSKCSYKTLYHIGTCAEMHMNDTLTSFLKVKMIHSSSAMSLVWKFYIPVLFQLPPFSLSLYCCSLFFWYFGFTINP